jgi:hypothetical protein
LKEIAEKSKKSEEKRILVLTGKEERSNLLSTRDGNPAA